MAVLKRNPRSIVIDLKWLLPVVMPFVLLFVARAVWFFAGAEWSDPALAAVFSLVTGLVLGALAASDSRCPDLQIVINLGEDKEVDHES